VKRRQRAADLARTMAATAAAAMLVVPGAAWAQPTAAETARQAPPATAAAADLQGYVLMVQQAEGRLRAAKDAAAREPASYSGGAMTPARQELMHATREAWRVMQRVPPALERSEAYRSAEREMRQALGEIGPTRTLSREEGDRAAEGALRALDGLRAQAAQAASSAGAPVAAPPMATGGGGGAGAR
jgi:hypothetical protein